MNSINIISPYKYHGQRVFDDPQVGLVREPFVAGADTLLDRATADIPDAERGFILLFSNTPFVGHEHRLDWRREEDFGHFDMEGWLCPALFLYFEEASQKLYVQVKSR